jgi:3-methyladenine DNA glycosylase AlkD
MLKALQKELRLAASSEQAKNLQRFFKTGPGEYAEGDLFLGLTVPQIRKFVCQAKNLELLDVLELLHSKFHEERLLALLILVERFKKAEPKMKERIYKLYLQNTKYINNWDLVDLSAGHIVGAFTFDQDTSILTKLAHSKSLWEKRIAMLATFYGIMQKNPTEALRIAEILLHDQHDLIHKAVGWMLREVGKRCSQEIEEDFLNKYYTTMPRTMLRYAIERFSEKKRLRYLAGKVK